MSASYKSAALARRRVIRAIMAHKITLRGWRSGTGVPDSAAVLADPGESPLYHSAARQDLEDMPVALGRDLHGDPHGCSPGSQLAGVPSIGPKQADAAAGPDRFHRTGRAPSRSWTDDAVILRPAAARPCSPRYDACSR